MIIIDSLENLDKSIRRGIQLLAELSKSRALIPKEREEVSIIHSDFLDRLAKKKLHLGIIGEFSSGKSTLINAILQQRLLATGDRPCTPAPIYLKGGRDEQLFVCFSDASTKKLPIDELDKYSSLDTKKTNIKYLSATVNAPFLIEHDIILVDTPGINAANPEHTKITESLLPEMHVGIFLIYSKQPGSKSTVEFLKKAHKSIYKLFICISKSDFLNETQLNRIVEELPKRLSKASNIAVDRVWPIHFSEEGADQEFFSFLNTLRIFMEKEFYSLLSKDLLKVLNEYNKKASGIVENRLLIQERLLQEHLKSNPLEFSSIKRKMQDEIPKFIEEEFDIEKFNFEIVSTYINNSRSKIRSKIREDLHIKEKNKKLFGMIPVKRRANKEEVETAKENIENSCSELCNDLEEQILSKVNTFVEKIKEYSLKKLSTINSAFSNFQSKLFQLLLSDPKIIELTKKAIFNKFVWIPITSIIVLSLLFFIGLILGFAEPALFIIPGFLFLFGIIIVPIEFALIANAVNNHPKKARIPIARSYMSNIEKFSLPSFGDAAAHEIDWENLGYQSIQKADDSGRYVAMTARTLHHMGHTGAAFAVLGVVASAQWISKWLSDPSVHEVCKEMEAIVDKLLSEMNRNINSKFQAVTEAMSGATRSYIEDLDKRYKVALNAAFSKNKILYLQKREAVEELESFMTRLKPISVELKQ